jgi:DnaK suppressor protein
MFVSLPQLTEFAVSRAEDALANEKEAHSRAAEAIQGINRGHDGASPHTKGRIAGFGRAAAGADDARRREVKAQTKVAAKTKKPAAKAAVKAKSAKPAPKAKPAAKAPAKKKAAAKPAAKTVAKTTKPAAKAARPVAKASAKPVARTAAKAAPAKSAKPAAKAAKPAAKPAKTAAGKALGAVAKAVVGGAKAVVAAAKKIPAKASPAPAKGTDGKASPSNAAPTRAAPQPASPPARSPSVPTGRGASAAAAALANAAPDGAMATYTPMANQSVVTPPPVVAVRKDPKLANNWKTKGAEELSDAEVLAMPDTEYMNDKQMAFFRLKLLQLKTDILNSAGETTEHLREDTVIVPDPADRATIEEEHALELRTRDRERKLLKKIEQSIARIDAGDYGYCDETGEPIGVGRLLARPTATLSLEAQQRRELKQKMFGD